MGWLILLGFLLWLVFSIKIVGPAEMAVLVLFGRPVKFYDSGFCFVPFLPGLKCYLARYPKKTYNFDYRAREVVTQAGYYKSEKEDKETYYGSQVLKVTSVVYLNFPREKRGKETTGDDLTDVKTVEEEIEINGEKKRVMVEKIHPLIGTLRAQVPVEDEKLKDWTEEAVLGALRIAFGRMTWREGVENIKKVAEEAEKVFKSPHGALIRAGFSQRDIQLVIAEIELPQKLKEAMTEVDRHRLEREAAPFEAEQRAKETVGAVMEMLCIETGLSRDEVEKAIKERPEEFVRKYNKVWEKNWDIVHRRMGIDGQAYLDIRTANPIQDLIALWKRMLMGKPGTKEKKRKMKKIIGLGGVEAEVPEEEEEEEI